MDGVLADFFAEYAKLAGVKPDERGRHDYHKIPQALREPVINQMQGTDFFLKLPKFGPGGAKTDALVDMVVKVFGKFSICSSPLRGDHDNSRAMKTAWIKKNLHIQPENIVITPNKGRDAPAKQSDGTPNILIDDRNTVLTEWENAGGIGIKYQADEDGLDVVARGIKQALEVIKGQRQHTPRNIISKDYGKIIASKDDNEVKEGAAAEYEHSDLVHDFINWVYKKEHIKGPMPEITFSNEKDEPGMHHTGWYRAHENKMWVYTHNRNLIDVLRTIAHELTHRKQGSEGRIKGHSPAGSKLEREADSEAGYLMKLYGKMHPEIIE